MHVPTPCLKTSQSFHVCVELGQSINMTPTHTNTNLHVCVRVHKTNTHTKYEYVFLKNGLKYTKQCIYIEGILPASKILKYLNYGSRKKLSVYVNLLLS